MLFLSFTSTNSFISISFSLIYLCVYLLSYSSFPYFLLVIRGITFFAANFYYLLPLLLSFFYFLFSRLLVCLLIFLFLISHSWYYFPFSLFLLLFTSTSAYFLLSLVLEVDNYLISHFQRLRGISLSRFFSPLLLRISISALLSFSYVSFLCPLIILFLIPSVLEESVLPGNTSLCLHSFLLLSLPTFSVSCSCSS